MNDRVHAARPDSNAPNTGHAKCAVCGQRVRPIAFGKWVHSDTGAVAAPNPPSLS